MKKSKDFLKPVVILAVLFVSVLILLNIGSKLFFSRNKINNYLTKATSPSSKLSVDYKKMQLSFSGSLSPFFAIKMSQVQIHYQECGMDITFKAPYLLIPFSMRKALNHDLQFGYVKAGKSEIIFRDSVAPCPDSVAEEKTLFSKLKEKQPENIDEIENFNLFFKKAKSIFKRVSGFRIQKLDYINLKVEKEKKVSFQHIRASYNKKLESIYTYCELNFAPSNFDIPGFTSKKNIHLKFKADLAKEDGLSVLASARHLEGLLTIESQPQKTLNHFVTTAKVKDLPLTFLSYVMGPKYLEMINSHRIWFNSQVVFHITDLFKSNETKVVGKFDNLEIFGPVLKSFASNFTVQFYPTYEISKDIDWRLDGLNLNGVLSQKNLAKISGVIDQLGNIRGAGKIKKDGQVSFEGLITESSFNFSMNKKKAQQVLTKANINLNYTHPKLNLHLENIVLEKAVFDGEIKGELVWEDEFEWQFTAHSEVFNLSDKIQKLYAIKQTPFENFKFHIQGQKRDLLRLTLSSNIDRIKTKWGEFRDSKYLLNYLPEKEVYKFNIVSKSFILDSHFLKIDFLDSYKNLKDFSTTLELSGLNKSFLLNTKTVTPPILLEAEGEDYNKNFMVNLHLDKTTFILEGHINSGFEVKSVQ